MSDSSIRDQTVRSYFNSAAVRIGGGIAATGASTAILAATLIKMPEITLAASAALVASGYFIGTGVFYFSKGLTTAIENAAKLSNSGLR